MREKVMTMQLGTACNVLASLKLLKQRRLFDARRKVRRVVTEPRRLRTFKLCLFLSVRSIHSMARRARRQQNSAQEEAE